MNEMGFFLNHIWLILLIPLCSFLVVGLLLQSRVSKISGLVATGSIFLTAFYAYGVAFDYLNLYPLGSEHPVLVPWSLNWLPYLNSLTVTLGALVDPLSILLMVIVTTVSSMVHLYSLGYMKGDPGFGRFFTVLNLFTLSMLGLVMAPNILQMFVFWELVGASSFFLIGFYYKKDSAVSASKKAFIVTRFADLGFLLGILILSYEGYALLQSEAFASFSMANAFDFSFLNHPETIKALSLNAPILSLGLILLFIGGAGKSAMFPLHIWLPDAMEGPTPVSALIHAATMVVAGIYLVGRLFPLFGASPLALSVVTFIGAFTCLFAAIIACSQDDIKRVLAFSTLSQLGYMMFSLGVATPTHQLGYLASNFHLMTHAFFKALLFLGAGSVIHAVHSNSVHDMGGLRKKLPITHLTFLIATIAIAGVPPFSGFFSKDEILLAALNGHPIVFSVGLLVAALTAFYMFRIYFLSFWGEAKTEGAKKAHESPLIMLIPLIFLAVLSVVSGWFPFSKFFLSQKELPHAPTWLPLLATGAGFIGIFISYLFYAKPSKGPEKVKDLLGGLYKAIVNKFYFDEIYLFITKKLIFNFIASPIAWFDRKVVDGAMNLTGHLTTASGFILKRLQTGQVQTYALMFLLGGLLLFIFVMSVGV